MVKKRISLGLLLLLLLVVLAGCQNEGTAKNVVFSREQKSTGGIECQYKVPVQQAEAVKKAEAAFRKYLNIQNINGNLVLKAALIEDDGILWTNPYWKLAWVGKDAKKPLYLAEIDAKSGEVVQLRYRPKWSHKVISREDVLGYQKTALAFIDGHALVKDSPISMFEASSSYWEGVFVEFRYGTGKFITVYFNEAGDVSGFGFMDRLAYTLQGNDLQVNREKAIEIARASIKRYYGKADTSGLIEQVQLIEGKQGEKAWFVYWKNIAVLEGRHMAYGAQIDALSGKLCAVEGNNHPLDESKREMSTEKLKEVADRMLQQTNLSGYHFEAVAQDMGTVNYRNNAGSPLHVYIDQSNGDVCFLSFIDLN